MYRRLAEVLKKYDDFKSRKSEELNRLNDRLKGLIRQRQEYFDLVAGDNRNDEARQRLDETDVDIADLKKEIGAKQSHYHLLLQSRRSRILQFQELVIRTLQHELKTKQHELLDLRNMQIPDAEKHLHALEELARTREEEIQQEQKEAKKISDLNLDVLFRESSS